MARVSRRSRYIQPNGAEATRRMALSNASPLAPSPRPTEVRRAVHRTYVPSARRDSAGTRRTRMPSRGISSSWTVSGCRGVSSTPSGRTGWPFLTIAPFRKAVVPYPVDTGTIGIHQSGTSFCSR